MTLPPLSDCAAQLGTSFTVQGAPAAMTWILAVAEASAYGGYSLIFHGPLDPVVAQQIVTLEHAEMGELSLFVVPVGPDGDAMRYQATVN